MPLPLDALPELTGRDPCDELDELDELELECTGAEPCDDDELDDELDELPPLPNRACAGTANNPTASRSVRTFMTCLRETLKYTLHPAPFVWVLGVETNTSLGHLVPGGKVPEFPDLELYRSALESRVVGATLQKIRFASPFVLRSVEPPVSSALGRKVLGTRRLGKRLIFELEGDFFIVVHLMVAGRLQWKEAGAKMPGRGGLASFDFSTGSLLLTEVSTKKRASIHVVNGEAALRAFDRGGLEVMTAHLDTFAERLRLENHTLKRTLTDPRLFSAIGNAYSDEILHRAKLSPVKQTKTLTGDDIGRLYEATRTVLTEGLERLKAEAGTKWPDKVTAFRPEMAVHGKFKQPCPVCGSPVQRIVHAENETNYCARCQTSGKLLADRSLSRLLKEDWPTTLDELEEYVSSRGAAR